MSLMNRKNSKGLETELCDTLVEVINQSEHLPPPHHNLRPAGQVVKERERERERERL